MLTGTSTFLTEQATLFAEAGAGSGQQQVAVSATSLQQSAVVFHEGKVTASMMETIVHLRTVFNHHLTNTASEGGSPVQHIVDALGCQVLVTLEKTTTTAIECSRLDLLHCQLSAAVMPAIRHHYMQGYLRGLMEHLTWLHGAVEAIASTVTLDNQSKKQIISSSWKAFEEVVGTAGEGGNHQNTLKVSIVNNALLGWELLHALLEIITLSGLREDEVKDVVTLVLRWLQCPHLEIIVSVVTCVSYLATSSSSDGSSNEGSSAGARLPVSYHSLLSNALINRAMQPSAFSLDASQGNLSRNDNVHRSSMLVMDVCVNALIDLHAGDDVDYLNAFAKMGLGGKLLSVQMELNQSWEVYRKKILSPEDEEKVQETLENLTNFLSYKHSCLNP